jgi:hypothetical protein
MPGYKYRGKNQPNVTYNNPVEAAQNAVTVKGSQKW